MEVYLTAVPGILLQAGIAFAFMFLAFSGVLLSLTTVVFWLWFARRDKKSGEVENSGAYYLFLFARSFGAAIGVVALLFVLLMAWNPDLM